MQSRKPTNIKRYTNFDLPVYKFVPGLAVHPAKNVEIPHIPHLPDSGEAFSLQNWQQSQRYLYAIDLFNLGYYWEVHEVLEKIWLSIGKNSAEGEFIQGLIQLSVALLKNIVKNHQGVQRLYEKALPKLKKQQGIFLGIDVEDFLQQFQKLMGEGLQTPTIELKFSE